MSRPNIEPQTQIARGKCNNCAGDVDVKVNKNRIAYYFCPHIDAETATPCGHHEKWGRGRSNRMIDRYLTKGQRPADPAANRNAPPTSAAANIDAPPAAAPEPETKPAGSEWDEYGI